MAVGKNPRKAKGGKKRQKYDAFAKKEWYRVRAPNTFVNRDMGWTPVNKSAGTKNSADSLKGRVFEFYLSDLKREGNSEAQYKEHDDKDGERAITRKIRLKTEESTNIDCYTNFYGMQMTTDKLRQCIHKWNTLVEAYEDVRTVDGYLLRLFCLARTEQGQAQIRTTSYAKSSQVRRIRQAMKKTINDEVSSSSLQQVVKKLIANTIADQVTRACKNIFPMEEVHVRKVKVLKSPVADYLKIRALHEGGGNDEAEFVDEELLEQDVVPDEEADINP